MNYYYYYYYYVQLTAVFQLNLGQPVPLLHLFQKRTPGDKWNGFLWAGCPSRHFTIMGRSARRGMIL